jgi:predicted ATP-dependent serine protease
MELETGLLLDNVLGSGLGPGLVYLAGQPGVGKSQLAMQWARQWAQRCPVLWISSNHPDRAAALADVIGLQCWNEQALPALTPDQLGQQLQDQRVVVIDDLSAWRANQRPLVTATDAAPDADEWSSVSRQLSDLAQQRQVLVLALVTSTASSLVAGSAMQDAHQVFHLKHSAPVTLELVKNRYGQGARVALSLRPSGQWLPLVDA